MFKCLGEFAPIGFFFCDFTLNYLREFYFKQHLSYLGEFNLLDFWAKEALTKDQV